MSSSSANGAGAPFGKRETGGGGLRIRKQVIRHRGWGGVGGKECETFNLHLRKSWQRA